MKKLLIIPAMLLALCLLAACGVSVEPGATAETTTEAIPAPAPQSKSVLFDFALIDRLFSMTYADFCQEEGRKVEAEGGYDGGVYCYFSKYGEYTPFFFDYAEPIADNDLLNAVFISTSELLVDRQALTLGELKRWLTESGVTCEVSRPEDLDYRFYFKWGKYEIMGDLDSDDDSAPIEGIGVYCKSNFDNHLT